MGNSKTKFAEETICQIEQLYKPIERSLDYDGGFDDLFLIAMRLIGVNQFFCKEREVREVNKAFISNPKALEKLGAINNFKLNSDYFKNPLPPRIISRIIAEKSETENTIYIIRIGDARDDDEQYETLIEIFSVSRDKNEISLIKESAPVPIKQTTVSTSWLGGDKIFVSYCAFEEGDDSLFRFSQKIGIDTSVVKETIATHGIERGEDDSDTDRSFDVITLQRADGIEMGYVTAACSMIYNQQRKLPIIYKNTTVDGGFYIHKIVHDALIKRPKFIGNLKENQTSTKETNDSEETRKTLVRTVTNVPAIPPSLQLLKGKDQMNEVILDYEEGILKDIQNSGGVVISRIPDVYIASLIPSQDSPPSSSLLIDVIDSLNSTNSPIPYILSSMGEVFGSKEVALSQGVNTFELSFDLGRENQKQLSIVVEEGDIEIVSQTDIEEVSSEYSKLKRLIKNSTGIELVHVPGDTVYSFSETQFHTMTAGIVNGFKPPLSDFERVITQFWINIVMIAPGSRKMFAKRFINS